MGGWMAESQANSSSASCILTGEYQSSSGKIATQSGKIDADEKW